MPVRKSSSFMSNNAIDSRLANSSLVPPLKWFYANFVDQTKISPLEKYMVLSYQLSSSSNLEHNRRFNSVVLN